MALTGGNASATASARTTQAERLFVRLKTSLLGHELLRLDRWPPPAEGRFCALLAPAAWALLPAAVRRRFEAALPDGG